MTDEQLLAAINGAKNEMLEHIHGVGAQLHTQIQEAINRMDARLDRQGGLIQGGARAITRMIDWTEKADSSFSGYDKRLPELENRLDQVEKGKNGKS